ncbi:HAD family hydrolase [Sphingomonas aracearum]|uniref:HAD family hydrolase n=1 Tax=Sphingomonas aracearum TaxID=2283317 RepID=A0A369VTR9_9SPHN|nr:HAD family hydrolase [Sphingomonas aracearum]RDE04570.1 HAD family hydrolase [Sphingomonas aracearum]
MQDQAIEAVLFDLDGTLVDSNELHVAAWAQVFEGAGHAIPAEVIRGQIGKGGDNLVPALLPDLAEEAQEELADEHGRLFKQAFIDRVIPFPDAAALLRRVRQTGAKVVLASSASGEELDHYVELLGVGDVISATTSTDDVGASKPAPDIFAVALKKAAVAPDRAVAVGDTPYDAESAGRAGVRTVGVLSGGFAESALREAGAVAIYRDVAELLARFEESLLAG